MKITLTFKTPDVLDFALDGIEDGMKCEVETLCKQWIEYGESVTIQIDTETNTAVVLEV